MLLLALFAFFLNSCQAQINQTIDDQYGDSVTGLIPVYSPSTGVWKGANCVGCAISADKSQAYNGSWTSATYTPDIGSISIAFPFTGSALYVYFITSNTPDSGTVTSLTQCNFTMDGQLVGNYRHVSDNSTVLDYNVLVYANTSLRDATHQFLISTTGQNHSVFVMFDYAIYTSDGTASGSPSIASNTSPTSVTSPVAASGSIFRHHTSEKATGEIVGGVLAGLAATSLAVGILIVCRRRRRRAREMIQTPYPPPPFREATRVVNVERSLRPLVSALSVGGTGLGYPHGELAALSNHTGSEPSDNTHPPPTVTNTSDASLYGTSRRYSGVLVGVSPQLNEKSNMWSSHEAQAPPQTYTQQETHGPRSSHSASSRGPSLSRCCRLGDSDVRHQVEMIREQVEQLQQAQQRSTWVQHLTHPQMTQQEAHTHSSPISAFSHGPSLSGCRMLGDSDVRHQVEMIRAQVEQLQQARVHLSSPPPGYDDSSSRRDQLEG